MPAVVVVTAAPEGVERWGVEVVQAAEEAAHLGLEGFLPHSAGVCDLMGKSDAMKDVCPFRRHRHHHPICLPLVWLGDFLENFEKKQIVLEHPPESEQAIDEML